MELNKKYILIVNPISGDTDKTDVIDLAKGFAEENAIDLHIYETTGDDDEGRLRSIQRKHHFERIIVAGGDGTIKMVAEAMEDIDVIVGILPLGSANGLAIDLNLPGNLEENLEIAFLADYKEIDIISINGKRSLHLADIGLNAELIKNYESGKLRGKIGYALQAIKTLSNNDDPFQARIEANNRVIETTARVIIIANSQKYGTGITINPDGLLDDGKFEVVIFKNLDWILVGKIVSGNMPLENDEVEIVSTSKALIETQSPVNFQIDGEYCDQVKRLEATVLPYKLKVAVLFLALLFFIPLAGLAQLLTDKNAFTRADSLRGQLTHLRSCYDIDYYHLAIQVDIENRHIQGSNVFNFTAVTDFEKLQFDLFDNLAIEKIIYHNRELPYKREYNAVFVEFPETIKKGTADSFQVFYSGNPVVAVRPPWDGGFVFTKDSNGKPWVSTANQGLGASAWWPNKDHLADEVDSMLISVSVPNKLVNVSNGRLRGKTDGGNGYTRYDWFVSHPINNYSVSLNIGDYVNFKDTLQGENGILDLDFWSLRENEAKAKAYFPENTKAMLRAFEHWFGPYPFYEDSYKLIDAPYLGMEHQSAVTYGNGYEFGYQGWDASGTGWGLKWDFIIIHESGHEWFGNNITARDIADMWIHEGFTNYSEALYIDYHFGKKAAQEYAYGIRKGIKNDKPIQGPYHVNREGSADMYPKGGVLLNMIRTIVDDDSKWRAILRGLNKDFYHQTVDYHDIVNYISSKSGIDLSSVFEQYVKHTTIPTLEFATQDGKLAYRWIADVADFTMPVRIRTKGKDYRFIYPTREFQQLDDPALTSEAIEVDTFNFYIHVLKH